MSGYLLESGTDRLLLEDASGVYLLDGVATGTTISGGQSAETSSAFAGVVLAGALILGGQATELDTANAGTVDAGTGGTVIAGGQAAETDTARAGTLAGPDISVSYPTAVLADAPLVYYRMGEEPQPPGDFPPGMLDSSGNGRNGAYYFGAELGQPGLISADDDGAVYFGGGADTGQSDWTAGLAQALTVEVWVRPDEFQTPAAMHSLAFLSGASDEGWQFGIADSRLEFSAIFRDHGEQVVTGATVLEPGVGHHVAATFDGTDLKVYLDGVLDGTLTLPAPSEINLASAIAHDFPVSILVPWRAGDETYRGTLDELAIYDEVLSEARLAAHVAAGSTSGTARETDIARAGSIVLHYGTTDTSNRVGGRSRGGYAVATWEPPVVEPPATIVHGESRAVALAHGPVTMNGTQPEFTVTRAEKVGHRNRIVVGGKDITYFRDKATPLPAYQLVSPLLYGPATLRIPQIAPAFEKIGINALNWLRPGKSVKVQRVNADGDIVATDYKGVVIAINASGGELSVEIGGEASGRAALMEQPLPIFRTVRDIGRLAFYAIRELELPFKPRLGPVTGIEIARFGGTGHLDYISQLCARAWTRAGNQWTIMPDPSDGIYRMVRKDTTTIDGTAYLDDATTVGDLRRDVAEEPNRIYATGVTPEGQRVRFGAYPGLKQGQAPPYPFNDDRNFSAGTTDADTNTGDGITVMVDQLRVFKYVTAKEAPGGYDSDVTEGIRQLQDDAGLPVTGTMTPATWRALYDLDSTGFSLQGARIQPAAQANSTREWFRSASGALVRRNENYQPLALKRDRTIDLGSGFTIAQMREFARAEIAAGNEDNWVGTITFHTGGLVDGNHSPGDPLTDVGVLRARALKPGMNLRLPHGPGGNLTVHVSAVSVDEDGKVTATVDTRARDSMAVWEVIERNRESRRDPARQWIRQHRASSEIKDAIDGWDEVGGLLGAKVSIPARTWTVFEVVAGQEGTIARLRARTNPNAEFVMAVFGRHIHPKLLNRAIGNPLTKAGAKRWANESVRNKLDADHLLLYVAGDKDQPLGYWPKNKRPDTVTVDEPNPDYDPSDDTNTIGTDDEPTIEVEHETGSITPLTGVWQDDAGFGYRTFAKPVLYVAVYADRATSIPGGRIMWPQLEAGA